MWYQSDGDGPPARRVGTKVLVSVPEVVFCFLLNILIDPTQGSGWLISR